MAVKEELLKAVEYFKSQEYECFWDLVYAGRLLSPFFIYIKHGSLFAFKDFLISRMKEYYPRVMIDTDIKNYNVYEILDVLASVEVLYDNGAPLQAIKRYIKLEFDDTIINIDCIDNLLDALSVNVKK